MIIFDTLEDALEEAKWCAEQEKKIYIIRRKGDKFKVTPKSRMRKYIFHIEVGFREGEA
jgi:hypothetical protein